MQQSNLGGGMSLSHQPLAFRPRPIANNVGPSAVMSTTASLDGHPGNAMPASHTAEDALAPAMDKLTLKAIDWAVMSDAGFSFETGRLGGSWDFDDLCGQAPKGREFADYKSF